MRRRPERVHAIVPLNVIGKSKTRLSPLLDPAQRARLTAAMLADVLRSLAGSSRIARVTVVSADRSALPIAQKYGARFLWEGKRRGLNGALKLAIRRLGSPVVMIVHADLPFVTTRDIDEFIMKSAGYQAVIVPSKDGMGTNALFLKPPNVMPPAFGGRSFRKHLFLAKKRKLHCKVLRIRAVQFDLDEPRDLRRFMKHGARNQTFRFLRTIL